MPLEDFDAYNQAWQDLDAGRCDTDARQVLARLRDLGVVDATYELALLRLEGRCENADPEAAFEDMWQLADKHFYPLAFYSIAYAYETGRGVGQDDELARQYYRQAMLRTYPYNEFAQAKFERFFSIRPKSTAAEWERKWVLSIENGPNDLKRRVAIDLICQSRNKAEVEAARHWLHELASSEHPADQFLYARMITRVGRPLTEVHNTSVFYLLEAAKAGFLPAIMDVVWDAEHGFLERQTEWDVLYWMERARLLGAGVEDEIDRFARTVRPMVRRDMEKKARRDHGGVRGVRVEEVPWFRSSASGRLPRTWPCSFYP